MADIPRPYLSEINRVFLSIRTSLDRPELRSAFDEAEIRELRSAYLRIEEIRFDFRSWLDNPSRRKMPAEVAIDRLREALVDLSGNHVFQMTAKEYPFHMMRSSRVHRYLHPALLDRESKISVLDSVHMLIETLSVIPIEEELPIFESGTRPRVSGAAIRHVVPNDQGIAPIMFEISSGRIVIVAQKARILGEDAANISSAKSQLVANGAKIIGELEKSNCDPRLLDTINALQLQLASDENIIQLGISNIGTEKMFVAFAAEIPDAVVAMMEAHTTGIDMYVGQFPEWHRFSEQASIANFEIDDIRTISDTAEKVIGELNSSPNLSDPSVPRTLQAISSVIRDPSNTSRKAAYAVWRSLENLIIKIFNYGADFLDQTIVKTIDKSSTAISQSVAVGLMTFGLGTAIAISPVATHMPDGKWIEKSIAVVKNQLKELG